MVGSSIGEWQLTQPADLRSASSRDWPVPLGDEFCGVAENPSKLVKSSPTETPENKAISKPCFTPFF